MPYKFLDFTASQDLENKAETADTTDTYFAKSVRELSKVALRTNRPYSVADVTLEGMPVMLLRQSGAPNRVFVRARQGWCEVHSHTSRSDLLKLAAGAAKGAPHGTLSVQRGAASIHTAPKRTVELAGTPRASWITGKIYTS